MPLQIPLRRVKAIPVEVKYNRVTGVRFLDRMVDGRRIGLLVAALSLLRLVAGRRRKT